MDNNHEEVRPLLSSDQTHLQNASHDLIAKSFKSTDSLAYQSRKFLQWFLTSKYGHYFVIILVSLDVAGIFGSFLITLHMCEHSAEDIRTWEIVDKALDVLSLIFSCLFMVELLCSIYAFGWRYFESKFHVFDALSIVASFLVDVLTHGPVEEAGSLIIILRLFRVFKIIEESSTVAEDSINELREKVTELERENASLRRRHVGPFESTLAV